MAADYILYGADHSLYTGKVRAYLRYKGLNFEERAATRDVYKSVILPRVGAPIVPVLETAAGEFMQDSTDIIDFLEARHPQASVYPATPVQRLVALLLELYGDEWLVIPAMHYRWSVLAQQRSVYFDFDSYTVAEQYRGMVETHARYLSGNTQQRIVIEGNTDERGGSEYNLALGQRRADAVRRMMTLLGVSDSQIETISFGKEKPRATGSSEADWAENRRADIVYQR